jgi:uncharacterized protein YmfQ (DUF2313 family)
VQIRLYNSSNNNHIALRFTEVTSRQLVLPFMLSKPVTRIRLQIVQRIDGSESILAQEDYRHSGFRLTNLVLDGSTLKVYANGSVLCIVTVTPMTVDRLELTGGAKKWLVDEMLVAPYAATDAEIKGWYEAKKPFEELHPPGEDIQPYKPDLMRYLPHYYVNSTIMKAIQDAYAEELGQVYYFLEDFMKQFLTPTTATWGLAFWEQELGLKTDISKSYEERREIIMARLRGIGTVGKNVIKRAAEAFSGGEVDVIEYPAEHRFVVKFVGTLGVPKNMASFIEMIEDLKPAHLTYGFEYTYTWWNTLKELTWAQAGMGTWNDLKVYG